MAFDQNSIPKDLRPLNIVRNLPDDPRSTPVTSSARPIEGFYANPPTDVGGSPGTMPAVYYPATVPDGGFVPLGFNNAVTGVTGWVQHVVPSQPQTGLVGAAVINSASGYSNSSNLGTRVASDYPSEEGGDDSVSGRKIKFLCSFGKIMPRLSDGALRYVGGQTRIISVRRDVSFGEFIQKMTDTYVQNVAIKYKLPDEDLDALVSVSCPDDLENMMDEYEKLIERFSDGSAKLRIFLFSPSELESLANIGDMQDGGQRYVEAVNGIMDGFSSSGRIARKESIESVVSGQNSDVSANEGADGLAHGLGEFTGLPSAGGLSPKGNSVVPSDIAPRMISVNPNPAPLNIPMVKSGPTMPLGAISEQEVERSMPLNFAPGVSFPAASPYVQSYVEPHQETLNHANYVQLPSQMGYPAPMLPPVRPVFNQQPQQFTPAVHMTINPSFISMKQNPAPNVVQQQHVRVEHYPAESMVAQRVVQLPAEQGYNAHPVYGWHQIPHPEQIAFSEGGLPPQPVMLPEKIPRLEDCHMCQKALPHAHSDTIAQEQKESPVGTISDLRSIYSSLHLDGRGRPMINEQLAGGPRPRVVGNNESHEFGKIQTENVEGLYVNDKAIPQRAENPELPKVTLPQGVVMTSGVQYPYGVFVANTPQSSQANAVQNLIVQPQLQVIQDPSINRPLSNDFAPVGIPLQTQDYVVHESPKEYSVKVAGGIPIDDPTSFASDNLRQIDERLENLRIRPSEVLSSNEQNKAIGEAPSVLNVPPTEPYEMTEPPPVGNPILYPYSAHGVNHLPPSDTTGNTVYSGEPPHAAERIVPVSEWKDNIAWSQPKMTGVVEASYGVGDIPDNSTSLFSNQDPWNMRPDTHFPPPRPSKIQIRKESAGLRDSLLDTPLDDGGGNLNQDFSLDHSLSNKGSAEELIKQELQAVAEGVAASVLHSSVPSNPDLSVYPRSASPPITQQNSDVHPANVEIQHRDTLEIIRNSDLEELRELGSGTFGTVYHGKWRGTDVAIKRINDRCFAGKPSEQDRMRDDFWNEAIKLADLHHPNVVAFYGVVLDGPDGSIATVTEFMVNGSLRNALQKSERNLDKRKRLLIGMDVAFGMEYLHGKNIVHFDLKSDNLLVNLRDPHRPICKVGDLGLSKVKCQTLISGGVRGTLPWMAPELLNGSSSLVSEKVDVFSFGIVMWELLTGEEPYADLHYGAIIGGIVSNTLRPPVPEPCDPDWRALMERCWSSEPSERPNFTDIANELRAMATKLPPKGQAQQQLPSTNPQSAPAHKIDDGDGVANSSKSNSKHLSA
ncbi:hypothetical protein DH2020_014295 [Rehmannia glutinosa]|uniref:Protein kinase domain-containing protein n=1 Tax=Rehmannia glutinosa TaxID=99300 RepID=A0ABR0WZL8_REHGL